MTHQQCPLVVARAQTMFVARVQLATFARMPWHLPDAIVSSCPERWQHCGRIGKEFASWKRARGNYRFQQSTGTSLTGIYSLVCQGRECAALIAAGFLQELSKCEVLLCSLPCESSFPLLWSLTLVARTGCFCSCNTPVWSCQIPLNCTIHLITSQFEAFISYLHLFSRLPQTTQAPLSVDVRGMCVAPSCTTLFYPCTLPLRPSKPTAKSTVEMKNGSLARLTHTLVHGSCLATALAAEEKERFPAM